MIYFDMDGVLAVFEKDAPIEDIFDPEGDYFRHCDPDWLMIRLLLKLEEDGLDVAILTQSPAGNAMRDKKDWAKDKGLGKIPIILVPYGQDKAEYIKKDEVNVLIDDYTRNLRLWEAAGHVGIKYYNGKNGAHGTWRGYSLYQNMTVNQMAVIVKAIAAETGRGDAA